MEEVLRTQNNSVNRGATYHATQLAKSLQGLQSRAVSRVKDTYNKTIRGNVERTFQNFGNNSYVSGSKEFLRSNSIIAKISVLFLVIFAFILLLRLGTFVLSMFLGFNDDVTLYKGMKKANSLSVIHQNPNVKGSKPIIRSRNKSDGIEFTYTTWIYIDGIDTNSSQYYHVFHKGNNNIQHDGQFRGMILPNNAPGVYLKYENNQCNMYVVMNTYSNMNEHIKVSDLSLHKWIYLVIRVDGKYLDIYINGTLAKRHVFNDVPKQNYGDVYINMNGGYDGYLSNLKYYDKSLTIREIHNELSKGPNMKMNTKSMQVDPPYFSIRWFFNQ